MAATKGGVAVGRDLAAGLAQRHHPLGQLDHLGAVAGLHRRDVGVEVQVVHDDPGERIGVVERHVQLGATALPLGERAAGRRVDLQGLRAEACVEVVDHGADEARPRAEVAVDGAK